MEPARGSRLTGDAMREAGGGTGGGSLSDVAAVAGRELGLRLVVLFGSAARGEPSPEDLDLAVLADEPLDAVELANYFSVLLARSDVDVVDLRRASPILMMRVAREGVPLFESDAAQFNAFCSLAVRRYADTRKFREAEKDAIQDFIARRVRTSP